MKPGKLQLDPKLYQYGGLWVYPIGGLLKLASLFHLVRLTPDLSFYLDHPEAFGRLYVVMRLYSAAWGLVGVAVMFGLARRISGSQLIGAIAAVCCTLLPTVINGAHEAKPHLAGAVLGLIAVDFAIRAIERGDWRWVIASGVACGAAASMVLSEWLVIGVLPAMAICLLWHGRLAHVSAQGRKIMGGPPMPRVIALLMGACVSALAAYAIFNPYVIVHLLGDRAVLQSNLENSAAMYQSPASVDGVLHGVVLLAEGGSTTIFFGMFAIAFFAWRKEPIAWLLVGATVPGLFVFLVHATGKPGEYGRFALALDVVLLLGATIAMRVFKRTIERVVAGAMLVLMLLPLGASYVLDYGRETFGGASRLVAAERLRTLPGAVTLGMDAEPAPYALPPVNLFDWKWVLLPRGAAMPGDVDVRIDPVDSAGADGANVQFVIRPVLLATPISWAGKPFRVEMRSGVDFAAKGQR
jgi:hypothetical protein